MSKNANVQTQSHNLDIRDYSFDELLGLFQLSVKKPIQFEDMKKARSYVLSMHPDKSRLPSEYFIFYKKALEQVNQYYENQNRTSKLVPTTEIEYHPIDVVPTIGKKSFNESVKQFSTEKFQSKFNELFDEHAAYKPDTSRNEWFISNEPVYSNMETVNSSKNMSSAFAKIKQQTSQIVRHTGVQNLQYGGGSAASFYDDDNVLPEGEYISSDPFSKLKYEDLRKVHKDQTVFAVNENDFHKVKQWTSVDAYRQSRDQQHFDPMDRIQAQKMIEEKDRILKETAMRKQHALEQQILQNQQKTQQVMSSFLRLQ